MGKTLEDEDFIQARKVFLDRWQLEKQNMAHHYEALKKLKDYDEPLSIFKREGCYSSLANETLDTENTNKRSREFKLKPGQKLSEIEILTDVFLAADVFRKNSKDSR